MKEEKVCPSCKQVHKEKYKAWSEYFQACMSPNEFINALKDSMGEGQ